MPLIWMKARFAVAEDSACDRALALVRDDGDLDIAIERAGLILVGCADLDATLGGNHRGDTMFTSGFARFMMPAMRRTVQRSRFICATDRHKGC